MELFKKTTFSVVNRCFAFPRFIIVFLLIVLSNLDDWFIFGGIFRANISIANYISGTSFLWLILLSLFLVRTTCFELSASLRPIGFKFITSFSSLSIFFYFLAWVSISLLLSLVFIIFNAADSQSIFKAAFTHSKNISNFLYLYVFLISHSIVFNSKTSIKFILKNIFHVVKQRYLFILLFFVLLFFVHDIFKGLFFTESVIEMVKIQVNSYDYFKYLAFQFLLSVFESYLLCLWSVIVVNDLKRLNNV